MAEDFDFIKKRLRELAEKSYNSGIFTFTDFLGLEEQSAFSEIKSSLRGIKYTAFGGAEGTSRVMLRFGDEDELGYSVDFPIVLLKAAPKSQKWADKLTHRDILGAVLNLGIERSSVGDIVIKENVAYIFVHEKIATFIKESLTQAKHTELSVTESEKLPDGELFKTEARLVQCASPRIDAVVAKAFSLSRDDSLTLFKRGLVFVDGRICENNSRELKEGETVSVRTKGRFIFRGTQSLSKKGKLNISLEVFV